MAEQNPNSGGNFVQQNDLFALEGPVTQFITNVYEFSDNLSGVIQDIVSFLNVASVFLRALKSPLEFLLLPILESLESYILDLKNIGAGVLTVWPWEVGKNPSSIDFSALLNGFQKFQDYYSSNESNSTVLTSEVQVQQQLEQNSSAFVGVKKLVDSETLLSQSSPDVKEEILSNYQSLKNFLDLDSSYWDENPTIQEGLKLTKKILNAKELTPSEVINIIAQSFDDVNDPQRPTGQGDYVAFIIIAALPTFSGINQVITQFSNFFGGIFDRVTPDGKETAKKIAMEEIIDLGVPVQPKNSSKDEEKYFFNQVKTLDLPDGIYKVGNDIIPMFEKGDLIVQTQESLFSQSFSAEVVKHNDIIVKDGIVLENSVTVRDVNGEIVKKHSNKKDSNPGIIRRNSNTEDVTKHPMFLPGDSAKAEKTREKYSLLATMEPNKLELTEVFPDIPELKKVKNVAKSGEDIYNSPYLYDEKFIQKYVDFAKTLSVGKTVNHPFLKTSENESTLSSDNRIDLIEQSKQLLNLIPGTGLNYHIKEILVEDTETGIVKPLEYKDLQRELFRFSEVEDSEKKNVEEKIIGMNQIKLKLGVMKSDGTIFDTSESAKKGVSPPGKVEFYNFSENLSNDRNNPSINMEGKKNDEKSGTPPNWKFYKISEFLPIYGEMIDQVVKIISSVKSWIKTKSDLIDEAIKFLEDFSRWLNDINRAILEALRLLTLGLNASGLYTLSLSGNGGPADFKAKLRRAKFLQKKANPFPSMQLETVEKTETITNPITGLEEVVTTKVLKPELVPADRENSTPTPLSASDLDHLKYSLGIVFYAQGNDSVGLDKFLTNFSTAETFVNAFLGNFNDSDTILEKIRPYVYDIQVLNSDGEYVSAENAEIDSDFKIRIVFTNDAYKLTDDEITALNNLQGRTVDIKPSVITSNLHLTKEDVDNGLSEFTLTKDGNQILLKNPPAISTSVGANNQVFYNVDFSTLEPLSASETGDSSYIFTAVANPLITNERIEITESKTLTSGFRIKQTSILDVEINYAI